MLTSAKTAILFLSFKDLSVAPNERKEDSVLRPRGTGNFASLQLSDSSVTVRTGTAGHRHVCSSPRNTVRDLSFSEEDAEQPTNTLSQPEGNAKE